MSFSQIMPPFRLLASKLQKVRYPLLWTCFCRFPKMVVKPRPFLLNVKNAVPGRLAEFFKWDPIDGQSVALPSSWGTTLASFERYVMTLADKERTTS